MPDDQSPSVELSLEQLSFVSKYLNVLPKKKWLRSSSRHRDKLDQVETDNDRIKRNYLEYDRVKGRVDALISEMERETGALREQYAAAAQSDPLNQDANFAAALKTYGDRLEQLKRTAAAKASDVESAAADAPVFGQGKQAFGIYETLLTGHRATLPVRPPVVVRDVVGALLQSAQAVAAQKAFTGVGGMTRDLACATLDDDAAETRRARALAAYDQACDTAAAGVQSLVDEARAGSDRSDAQLRDLATGIVADLPGDCAAPLGDLRKVLNERAAAQLETLKADTTAVGDIARREAYRLEEIETRGARLDSAIDKLSAKTAQLLIDKAKATGFNEIRETAAEYEAEKTRLEDLRARRAQLDLYRDGLSERTARLERARDDFNAARDLVGDPDAFLDAHRPLPDPPPNAVIFPVRGGYGADRPIDMIEQARASYVRAAETVAVQEQLFMGEPGLTRISLQQFSVLDMILDKAEAKVRADSIEDGQALLVEANRLFTRFLAAQQFMLPDLPEPPPSRADQVEKDLARLSVRLDRFWGRGGDADDALRGDLDDIVTARDRALAAGSDALSAIEDRIRDFASALDEAERGYVPNPMDQLSRDKAAGAGNEIKKGLLDLFSTRPLDEAEVRDIPPKFLLSIDNGDGTRSYHEIRSHKDGTESRRSDKHIPREAMAQLLDKARMLDALAECESPDCSDMILAAVAEAEADLVAIRDGGTAYDHITSVLKACDVLLGDRIFTEWRPALFPDTQTKYDTFKAGYATKMRPDDASAKADEFHAALKSRKTEAETLRTRYKAVADKLDRIERDLDGGSKAAADGLAKKLRDMVKSGPEAMLAGLVTGPLSDDEQADLTALIDTLKTDMAYLQTTLKDHKGIEGRHRARLSVARQTLEARSTDGIAGAGRIADEIGTAMQDEIDELATLDAANGAGDLRKLATFVAAAARGQRDRQDQDRKAEAARQELGIALNTARTFLKSNRKTMLNHNEFKAVFDSINTQYKTTVKVHKKTGDADKALSDYNMQKKTALQLNADMQQGTAVGKQGGDGISTDFITQLAAAVLNRLEQAQKAAGDTGAAIKARATEDDAQGTDTDLQANVDAVQAVLDLAAGADAARLAALRPYTKASVDAALALDPTDPKRKADFAAAREFALASVRAIRERLDSDPALKVYRDNPFDKGAAYPAVVVALHELEQRLIRDLDPAKL